MNVMLDIGIIDKLVKSTDAASLTATLMQAAYALGGQGFFCTIRCARPHVDPVVWAFSSDAQWSTQVLALQIDPVNPLLPWYREQDGVTSWTLAESETQGGIFSAICREAGFKSGTAVQISQDPIWKMSLVFTGHTHEEGVLQTNAWIRVLSVALLHTLIVKVMPGLVNANLPKISAREVSCLSWAARGYTSADIATKLDVSEPTVVFHINNLIRKLGVNNRTQAIAVGIAKGLTY